VSSVAVCPQLLNVSSFRAACHLEPGSVLSLRSAFVCPELAKCVLGCCVSSFSVPKSCLTCYQTMTKKVQFIIMLTVTHCN